MDNLERKVAEIKPIAKESDSLRKKTLYQSFTDYATDVTAAWTFYTPAYGVIEYFAGMDLKEIMKAFDFSGEDEKNAMLDLIEQVEGGSLRLDAGFNDRKLVRKIAEFGMLPYVYPYKSNNLNGNNAWKEMYLEFFTDVIFWLQEYYLRVHCESFHSSFKRIFGIIRKVRGHSKFIQVMARIILHNRARLSYFKKIKKD